MFWRRHFFRVVLPCIASETANERKRKMNAPDKGKCSSHTAAVFACFCHAVNVVVIGAALGAYEVSGTSSSSVYEWMPLDTDLWWRMRHLTNGISTLHFALVSMWISSIVWYASDALFYVLRKHFFRSAIAATTATTPCVPVSSYGSTSDTRLFDLPPVGHVSRGHTIILLVGTSGLYLVYTFSYLFVAQALGSVAQSTMDTLQLLWVVVLMDHSCGSWRPRFGLSCLLLISLMVWTHTEFPPWAQAWPWYVCSVGVVGMNAMSAVAIEQISKTIDVSVFLYKQSICIVFLMSCAILVAASFEPNAFASLWWDASWIRDVCLYVMIRHVCNWLGTVSESLAIQHLGAYVFTLWQTCAYPLFVVALQRFLSHEDSTERSLQVDAANAEDDLGYADYSAVALVTAAISFTCALATKDV